jgi:hypothetical protein
MRLVVGQVCITKTLRLQHHTLPVRALGPQLAYCLTFHTGFYMDYTPYMNEDLGNGAFVAALPTEVRDWMVKHPDPSAEPLWSDTAKCTVGLSDGIPIAHVPVNILTKKETKTVNIDENYMDPDATLPTDMVDPPVVDPPKQTVDKQPVEIPKPDNQEKPSRPAPSDTQGETPVKDKPVPDDIGEPPNKGEGQTQTLGRPQAQPTKADAQSTKEATSSGQSAPAKDSGSEQEQTRPSYGLTQNNKNIQEPGRQGQTKEPGNTEQKAGNDQNNNNKATRRISLRRQTTDRPIRR